MLTLRLSVIAALITTLSACGTAPPNTAHQIPAAEPLPRTQQYRLQQQPPRYVAQNRQAVTAQQYNERLRQQEQQAAAQQLAYQRQAEARRQQQAAAQQQTEAARQRQLAEARRQQAAQQMAAERQRQAAQQQLAQRQPEPPPVQQRYQRPLPPPPTVVPQYAASRMYTGPGRFQRLPDAVATNLRLRGVSERGMSAYVRPASGAQPALVTANADTPRNPASTMKLVTTYAALGVLGPNYQWPTELYITGNVSGGTLYGDVVLKGYGDPGFSENDFRRILQALRGQGITNIKGNLVADNSFFNVPYQDPGAFDGNANADYNAQPEAILYQERGGCYEFTNLKGKIEKICPILPRNAKARADLNTNLFGGFWKLWVGELRGQMQGSFVRGNTPGNAQLVYTHRSRPLREIIIEINKDSNNVMARQILLSIGAKQMGIPGTPAKGANAIGQWLSTRGLSFPELRIENGSGLSRIARISARHLGEMLVDAYNSPYRNDLMNSLPVLGVDGTLKNRMKRSAMTGRGKFKTGTLKDVRGLAGYLQASDGQTYVISILHNDPRARSKGREAHDEMVEWVYWGPRNNFAGL